MISVTVNKEEEGYFIVHDHDDDIYASGETIEEAVTNFYDVHSMIMNIRAEEAKKEALHAVQLSTDITSSVRFHLNLPAYVTT